jgi:phosphoglycerol transferase MdoB-like AlkP superfamily enzyme
MEESNPYAPPADQQSSTSISLADLDLSKLTPIERKFLESAYSKPNISWKMALWLAGIKVVGSVLAFSSGKWGVNTVVLVLIISAGYLALGYWARTWSRLATFVLLVCHVLLTHQELLNDNWRVKLVAGIPALIFFFGFITARSRFELTKKATPEPDTNLKPRA